MASSSLVQFKYYYSDIAGNEVSPTKQARGDNGMEPKLHRWQNREKNLGRNQAQLGASSPLARRTSSSFQLQQSQIGPDFVEMVTSE